MIERQLGAHNRQIDGFALRQIEQAIDIRHVDGNRGGDAADPGVSGSADHRGHRPIAAERPDQRVLTAAAADNEEFHERCAGGRRNRSDRHRGPATEIGPRLIPINPAIDQRSALRLESALTRDSLICSSESAGPARVSSRGRKGGVSGLAEVKVQEGESIESALRRFKRKVQQEDIIKDIKKHSYYLKPGDRRRAKQALARKRTRKKQRRESD
jgi:small subunit ribosomal protein S21